MAVHAVSHAQTHHVQQTPPVHNKAPQTQAPKSEPAHTETKNTSKVDIKA